MNIVFYVLIALIYGFVAFLIVVKINNGSVYLFNTRYDVVLTDSMSEKNEAHLDFLEGTTQIQAFDLVKSKKITEDTEVKEKDIVLFKNPNMNNATVMHRIVRVIERGDKLTTNYIDKNTYQNIDCLSFHSDGSWIKLSTYDIKSIQLEVISPEEYKGQYSFEIGGVDYSSISVQSTSYDGYYIHQVTCSKASHAPMESKILKKTNGESYLTKITFESYTSGSIVFNATEFVDEDEPFTKMFNSYYLYEIRGDKAKDSDGVFSRDVLLSKVDGSVPKLGYVVRFLTSLPGLIMLIGLALLATLTSYFWNKGGFSSKNKVVTDNNSDNVLTETKEKGESNEKQKSND